MAHVEAYLKAVGMFRDYSSSSQDPIFSDFFELDLCTVVPSLSGPKRPHDRVAVTNMKADFQMCLDNKVCLHVDKLVDTTLYVFLSSLLVKFMTKLHCTEKKPVFQLVHVHVCCWEYLTMYLCS